MKITPLIDRMDDWLNPIVIKELRQAVKSRVVLGLLLIFLGLQLFLVGLVVVLGEAQKGGDGSVNWTAGRDIFAILQGLLLVTLMVLVPAYACIRLGSERSDTNVDLLFISTLRPRSIIAGKFFAALVLAMLIFSACAPFMTFTYLLRGIDIPTILFTLFIDLLCMVAGTMVALFLAALPGTRPVKFFFCAVGFVVLGILCIFLVRGTNILIQEGVRLLDNEQFWVAMGSVIGLGLAWTGLLFFYAVALVSPVSSNRTLPIRIYVLALWLASGAAVWAYLGTSSHNERFVPLLFWVTALSMILGVQLIVSLSERDWWGPHVARTIPRTGLLRLGAFFLYSGAAGGVSQTLILIFLTLAPAYLWLIDASIATIDMRGVDAVLAVCLVALLYLYCYGLSAVLVRVYLLSGQVRAGMTWIIILLLVGLGSSVPAVIAYIAFPEQIHMSGTEATWWKLPSPFLSMAEVSPAMNGGTFGQGSYMETCLWFLAIWALTVSLLCLPWFMGQVTRFRPLARRQVRLAASVAAVNGEAAHESKTEALPVPEAAPATSIQTG